ncbi:D-3-phosphoglycerate dehydrogenase [Balneicella halophila]|uniref:D-3-phosphoglycerate dehydrogenase n=1 Tax=Balneicella halophila TaxID=1537566 RepID=A0A7L4USX1_BALHA|nr:NAD(P)-dependent oxidoreductase [Balneicella halophila]PVX52652.1 D-3-phosphoglycerate dehydrogenase [Balneicella halophila]
MKRVLIINEVDPITFEELDRANIQYDYNPKITETEFLNSIKEYNGLMLTSKFRITKDVIDKAEKLEVIGRIGAGLENIDTAYAESKGIICHNAPEGNRDAVGEQAVGMLLMLMNNLRRADNEVRQGIWKREANRGFEIKGKTLGIIGYGNMGNAFAQRLHGFEAKVIAYDKYKLNYGNVFAQEVTLETIFNEADILSLHTPLTDETKYMVNEEFLSKFKNPIILINTSRGKVVKTDALAYAMKAGKVTGACLDVLEYEAYNYTTNFGAGMPESLNYLIHSDRVVLSPHIAGWTFESKRKLSYYTVKKIIHSLI